VPPEDDFGPGYSPDAAVESEEANSGFGGGFPANPFAKQSSETQPDQPSESSEEPAAGFPSSFLASDPFAPLRRPEAGEKAEEPEQEPKEEEPVSFLEPPESAAQMPEEAAEPEPATPFGGGESARTEPSDSPLPSFDELIPDQQPSGEGAFATGGTSLFEELEKDAEEESKSGPPAAAPVEPQPAPAPAPQATGLPPVDDEVVSDIELRAVFGVSDQFDAQKVADLTSELPGVAACVITGSLGVFQGRSGADPDFANKAETLVRSARDFAVATGVPNAESFTIHTDRGAISVFVSGDDRCLAVRHNPGGFDPGVREKLILVARGLAALKY